MRALALTLAEFIMRGRLQAGTIAILGYIVPLLAPAAVALVSLRQGAVAGTTVLMMGLSPAILSLVFDDQGSIVVWVTLLSLAAIYISALVLRATVSMPLMVIAAVLSAASIVGLILLLMPDAIAQLAQSIAKQLELSEAQQQAFSPMATVAGVSGLMAYMLAFNTLIGVLLGRWLQSLVFNPGGFGDEFLELRLGAVASVACFALAVLLRYQGPEYWWWSNVVMAPLVLVAIAVAHKVAQLKGLAVPWLVLFYGVAFIFTPVVMCIGLIDAWINFRSRLQNKQ